MNNKLVCTISACIQVGEDEFVQHRMSKVFDKKCSIEEMLSFAESCGIKNPQINDLILSDLAE